MATQLKNENIKLINEKWSYTFKNDFQVSHILGSFILKFHTRLLNVTFIYFPYLNGHKRMPLHWLITKYY